MQLLFRMRFIKWTQMKMVAISFAIIFQVISHTLYGQTGGQSSFLFLNLSPSARNTALGSYAISWPGSDPTSAYLNPSLLNDKMNTAISFNHQFYFDGIDAGHVSYSQLIKKWNINAQAGIQYISSDKIVAADEIGNIYGTTDANELDFFVVGSRKFNDRITLGASIHYINSHLGLFSSNALATSISGLYFNPEKNYGLSLVLRNLGVVLDAYDIEKEKLPFTVELGFSKRLLHLPFIYYITAHHLETGNVRYDDPNLNSNSDIFGNVKEKSAFTKWTNNVLRHFSLGGEMLLGKKEQFNLRLGYNHLRKKDLSVADYTTFGGLSYGIGFKIYKFKIDYSYAKYHIAGGTNQFSITTSINSFLKNTKL